MKFSYNWLQSFFAEKLPEPEKLEKIIGLKSFESEDLKKIGNDYLLEFDVLANRAHDCLSHLGLAREIKALTGIELKNDSRNALPKENKSHYKIINQEPDLCLQYYGREIKNISIKESPEWLKERLITIGQKPINNIVDATNYVMFEIGQPLHAFDQEKITGQEIIIRKAKEKEEIILLGGENKILDSDTLVISDQENPIGIAGIKGGKKAEVDDKTKNIILESAYFNSTFTRKASRKIKIQTDASKRFENEFSQHLSKIAIDKVTQLILEIAGEEKTEISEIFAFESKIPEQKTISLPFFKIKNLTGFEYEPLEIVVVFKNLGMEVSYENDSFLVTIPKHRLDLKNEADLIEEIVRILDYEKIPSILPEKQIINHWSEQQINFAIKIWLSNKNFKELMTYVFQNKGKVQMANALASDKTYLRENLETGVLESLEKNKNQLDYLELSDLRLFEIGYVFPEKGKQDFHLAIAHYNPKKKEKINLIEIWETLKNDLNISGEIKKTADNFLEIKILIKNEIEDNSILNNSDYALERQTISQAKLEFKKISNFPFITRDFSFWYKTEEQIDQVKKIIQKFGGELLVTNPKIIDQYQKEEEKSLSLRFVFQAQDRTLTDNEVNLIMDLISENAKFLGVIPR